MLFFYEKDTFRQKSALKLVFPTSQASGERKAVTFSYLLMLASVWGAKSFPSLLLFRTFINNIFCVSSSSDRLGELADQLSGWREARGAVAVGSGFGVIVSAGVEFGQFV